MLNQRVVEKKSIYVQRYSWSFNILWGGMKLWDEALKFSGGGGLVTFVAGYAVNFSRHKAP